MEKELILQMIKEEVYFKRITAGEIYDVIGIAKIDLEKDNYEKCEHKWFYNSNNGGYGWDECRVCGKFK